MLDLGLVSVIAYVIGVSAGLGLLLQLYRAYKQYKQEKEDKAFADSWNADLGLKWDAPISNPEFAQDFPKVTKRINAKVKKSKAKKAKKAVKASNKTKKTTSKVSK
jgi:heme/copper-type cytochrome/quinol oxidase subunit 1